MPTSKKRVVLEQRSSTNKNKVITNLILVIVIALIIALGIFFFSNVKDCGADEACFKTAAENCKLAKLTSFKDENTFLYEIKGSRQDNCLILVEITKISDSASADLKETFEGKKMICNIPKQQFAETPVADIDQIIDYCTGPLKEAMLEVMIKELYSIIAKNLGGIVLELEDVIS